MGQWEGERAPHHHTDPCLGDTPRLPSAPTVCQAGWGHGRGEGVTAALLPPVGRGHGPPSCQRESQEPLPWQSVEPGPQRPSSSSWHRLCTELAGPRGTGVAGAGGVCIRVGAIGRSQLVQTVPAWVGGTEQGDSRAEEPRVGGQAPPLLEPRPPPEKGG